MELNKSRNLDGSSRHGVRRAISLAFAGGLAELRSLNPECVTVAGLKRRMFRLKAGVTGMG
jgi:hypothetical protein